MNRKIARKVIAKIAKREGIKESEVREEMSKAIVAGYNNKETRGKWDEIFGKDTIPSPEEFITTIGGDCGKIKEQYSLQGIVPLVGFIFEQV